MEANELMLGNWVNAHRSECVGEGGQYAEWEEYGKVTRIYEDVVMLLYPTRVDEWEEIDIKDLEPIPLTPEILKKNGFEEWDEWLIYSPEGTGIEIAWVGTILKIGGECGNLELPTIEYVHQLQNVFMLCGISKEIVL